MKKVCFAAAVLLLTLSFLSVPVSAREYDYEDNGFHYYVVKKKAVITGTEIQGEQLTVPASLGGFTVTGIAPEAFSKSKFTDVVFPNTIADIGEGAFFGCKKLKSIQIPKKLTRLKGHVFSGCTKLAEVQLNGKLQSIGRGTFSNCIALKKIVLPGSVSSIGDRAFEKCYKLTSIQLNKKITRIGRQAFYKDYSLKTIRIPYRVTDVGDRAFKQCEGLMNVRFDNAETKLGTAVFQQCTSLKKAVLPKGLKNIPEATFAECTKLRKVIVPKNISIIKRNAFWGCRSLKKVVLNAKIYAIGDHAFAYSGLKKIRLNRNMQFIGNGAFQRTGIRNFALTSKVTFIGNRVFADCKSLKTITIPDSVKGINPGAFNNCVSLRSINVSAGNKYYSSEAGVLYDKGKTKLIQYPLHKTNQSFRTPSGLKVIRSNAFSGNPFLRNVTISADVIGEQAFCRMKNLKTVTVSAGVGKIGNYAFWRSSSLQRISLPDSVTSIGRLAFAGTAVKRIHIPSGLARLGEKAFYNCKKLQAFEGGRGIKYKVQDGVLYNGSMTELIKYPAQKPNKVFVVPNSVRRVKWRSFEFVSRLTKLEFGNNLRTLEFCSIYKANRLKSIVFHSSRFSYISSYSVIGCNKLAVIVGPNNGALRDLADSANATLITL